MIEYNYLLYMYTERYLFGNIQKKIWEDIPHPHCLKLFSLEWGMGLGVIKDNFCLICITWLFYKKEHIQVLVMKLK